jgi:hypothetical protein
MQYTHITFRKVIKALALVQIGNGSQSNTYTQTLISGPDYRDRLGIFITDTDTGRDSVGHILPFAFGGLAAGIAAVREGNIFPQQRQANNNLGGTVESQLARMVRSGTRVCMQWTFEYRDSRHPARPTKYFLEYFVNGAAEPTRVSIDNPPPV